MTYEEFKILAKGMKATFTEPYFLPDKDSFEIWYQMLKDLDYGIANLAIQTYIMTNKKHPTIADIRELASTVVGKQIDDFGKAWEQVLLAIRKKGMYQEQAALEMMDELTQQCVKRLGFRNICTSENLNQDRANFRMIYEQLSQRKKNENQLQPQVRTMIESIQGKLIERKE